MGSHAAAQFEAQGLNTRADDLPAGPEATPRACARPSPATDGSPAALNQLLPLSLSQREVWLDQRAWPGSCHLNIGGAAVLRGPLDIGRLQASLQLLVERHEALRLRPRKDEQQVLLAHHEAVLEQIELAEASEPEALAAMARHWNARMNEPFELGEQPPWRFILLRAHAGLHGLSIQFHHLVMDGWGTTQVMQAWSALYQGLDTEGGGQAHEERPGPGKRYSDHIEDSLRYRQSALFARDAAFWRQELAPLAAQPRLPLLERRTPRSAAAEGPPQLPAAHLVQLPLEARAYAALEQRARSQGLSSFNVLLAAMALYFGRISGQRQLLIGVPSLNRSGQRFRHTPGMFTGLQCLRLDLDSASCAAALMQQASAQMQAALRHARYPLSELAHELPGLHMPGQGEMLELLLSFERQDYRLPFGQARLEASRQLFSGRARFPLALTLCEFDGGASPALVLEASSEHFEAGEAKLLAQRLWRLAQRLSDAPDAGLEQIALLPEEEHWALIHGLHKNLARQETPRTWLEQFRHQAGLQPQACALVWDGPDGTETLSYGQLLARGEALARRLRALGVAREQRVAVAMERSPELVVALLGIGLAGAAFLPLDPQAPSARLAGVLLDSGAPLLLLDPAGPPGLAALVGLPGLPARSLTLPLAEEPRHEPEHEARPAPELEPARIADLAYVLFTSGSTGRPKGVMVEHGALSRRLAWLARHWQLGPQDRAIQGTHHGFDPALVELLLPLSLGASIALPPPGRLHPRRLAEQMARHGATFGAFVPSTLAGLVEAWAQARRQGLPPPSLRVACCGGELLSPELVRRFQSLCTAQLYNVYGPTEACIFSSAWLCAREGEASLALDIPLGRPVDDTRIYVLDAQLQALPFGVCGEIYIGGPALARGYLGRPDLDAERFLPDPFQPEDPSARLYRSGDRGWLDSKGCLHFGGRLDRQIKLRGQRIELGDVEAACLRLPGVLQAAVSLIQEPGPAHLHAWLAGPDLREQDRPALMAGLRLSLPEVMRPRALSLLPELPVNAQGKVLSSALPRPPEPGGSQKGMAALPRAPQDALELRLLQLWSEALPAAARLAAEQGHQLDLDADFFALGGDSLAALGILASLEDELGERLPLQLMQEHPSIASLAQALRRPQELAERCSPRAVLRTLPPRRGRRAGDAANEAAPTGATQLFVAASGHGDVMRLQQLADVLPAGVQLSMLQPPLDGALRSLEDLARLYAEAISRARRPGQRCWLAGFSVGGVTALATAVQLQSQSQAPEGLLLLDTIHPEAVLGGTASWRGLGWLVRKLHVQDLSLNGRRLGAMFSDPGLVSQVQALRGHRCRAFEGPVLLLQSAGLARWQGLLFRGWRKLMPRQLQVRQIPGTHGSIFEPAHVDGLAEALSQFMGHTERA